MFNVTCGMTRTQPASSGRHRRRWFLRTSLAILGTLLLSFSVNWQAAAGKDLYKILGVSRGVKAADLKKAYRKMSQKYHPDLNKGDPAANDKFAEIAEAYEVLSDSKTREEYDRLGYQRYKESEAERQSGGGGPHDFFDFFVGRTRGRGREKDGLSKGPSTQFTIPVSLSQLYFGDLLQISFDRPVLCLRVDDCYIDNPNCSGPGIATITQSFGSGFILQNQVADDSCVDSGKGWKPNCRACPHGPTESHRTRTSVFIERGAADGDKIVFENGGVQRLGYQPGDVEFTLKQLPHPVYNRHGNNLHTHMYLTLTEALAGFNRTVPHVSKVPLHVARSEVTHDGMTQVMPGKGMPKQGGAEFGDLHIVFHVQYPFELLEPEKELIKKALQNITKWKFEAIVSE